MTYLTGNIQTRTRLLNLHYFLFTLIEHILLQNLKICWRSPVDISLYGWTDKCEIQWTDKAFPDNIKGLLLDDNDEKTALQFGADNDNDDDNQ